MNHLRGQGEPVATGCCGEAGPPLWPLATNLAFPLQRIAKAENRRKPGVRTGRPGQCLKFSLRAGAGPAVDVAILLPLAGLRMSGNHTVVAKVCRAQVALPNNLHLFGTELRGFRTMESCSSRSATALRRLVLLHALRGGWTGLPRVVADGSYGHDPQALHDGLAALAGAALCTRTRKATFQRKPSG